MRANLYNVPSGVPFAASLAQGLLDETGGDALALSQIQILLPSRRACRTVRDAFLQQSNGKPLLLPRLQPLGDVEEEELAIGLAGSTLADDILNLPPAMPPLRRRILLARAIMQAGDTARGPEQALALAGDLGQLMDQIHTEGLSLDHLPGLVAEDFARHWQLTTDFLKILSEVWPHILAANGMIDGADRRNRLLRLLSKHWRDHPPAHKVIAAGSTGSIPAAGELLAVIAHMPQGRVVLPGLDTVMDEDSWATLDDTHPQATLKILLQRVGAERSDVGVWPTAEQLQQEQAARRSLASELMRPAPTTDQWNRLGSRKAELNAALNNLERQDCDTPEEEARLIALMFRRALDNPDATAALVTPDRDLARRVAMACRRWNLEVDDSAGQRLHETPVGTYTRLVMQAVSDHLSPATLLALLRHRLCRAGLDHGALERQASLLEKSLLRGPKPPPGFAGLRNRAAQVEAGRPQAVSSLNKSRALLDRLEPILSDLLILCDGQKHPASLWLQKHLAAAEALAAGSNPEDESLLWQGEAGEQAAQFFAGLIEESHNLPPLDASGYLIALTQLMAGETVRPRYGTHPRLSILGQLEARLLQADLVILGGLNERVWPPDPGHDPWLSRPMRAAFGLPSPERAIGLAAHDFVQGFCARNVVLTRSLRQDAAPTVPARWLQRLDTVLQAASIDPAQLSHTGMPWLALVRAMDRADDVKPASRPAPAPPVDKRPRELPVTAIETWLQDPYAIYAKYVLRLRKLDPLERQPDAAARGTFLHDVLNDFITAHKNDLPTDASRILIDLGHKHFERLADDSGFWRYWLPRFDRIATWLAGHETEWREHARPGLVEAKGMIMLQGPAGAFTLTARADRIDHMKAGGAAIIDYKTGGTWSPKAMENGSAPQLPLEGLILDRGGFAGVSGPAHYLGYWKLTGGVKEGDVTAIEGDTVRAAIANARAGLEALIAAYDDPAMPYFSLPDPERKPRFQDYAQLARVQEWSVADDSADVEDAA